MALILAAFSLHAEASILDNVRDYIFGTPEPKVFGVEEARDEMDRLAKEFASLGLGPVKDAQIDDLVDNYEAIPEANRGGIDLTLQLLYEIGAGKENYQTGK